MVTLDALREDEFEAWLDVAIADYAREKVAADNWAADAAQELSRRAYHELLPDGLNTQGQHVMAIRNDGSTWLGVLWYEVSERGDKPAVFVNELFVLESQRRRGYGSAAMRALEDRVREVGLDAIYLHVFGHNAAARALYEKLGYQVTNLYMAKTLDGPQEAAATETSESSFVVRAVEAGDREWVRELTVREWHDEFVVVHGAVYWPHELPGWVAVRDGERVGLASYRIDGPACELVMLNSLQPGAGIGSALIDALRQTAQAAGCTRLWLVTTNDNLHALRFYQRRGFHLVAVRPDALAIARRLKPSIPLIGEGGIPLRDEIELEMSIEPDRA